MEKIKRRNTDANGNLKLDFQRAHERDRCLDKFVC